VNGNKRRSLETGGKPRYVKTAVLTFNRLKHCPTSAVRWWTEAKFYLLLRSLSLRNKEPIWFDLSSAKQALLSVSLDVTQTKVAFSPMSRNYSRSWTYIVFCPSWTKLPRAEGPPPEQAQCNALRLFTFCSPTYRNRVEKHDHVHENSGIAGLSTGGGEPQPPVILTEVLCLPGRRDVFVCFESNQKFKDILQLTHV